MCYNTDNPVWPDRIPLQKILTTAQLKIVCTSPVVSEEPVILAKAMVLPHALVLISVSFIANMIAMTAHYGRSKEFRIQSKMNLVYIKKLTAIRKKNVCAIKKMRARKMARHKKHPGIPPQIKVLAKGVTIYNGSMRVRATAIAAMTGQEFLQPSAWF